MIFTSIFNEVKDGIDSIQSRDFYMNLFVGDSKSFDFPFLSSAKIGVKMMVFG